MMGNNRYRKGYEYERKIVNRARENGHISYRSAGSHSPIDVTIIDFKNKKISLLQCKAGEQLTDKLRFELLKKHAYLYGNYKIEFDVI